MDCVECYAPTPDDSPEGLCAECRPAAALAAVTEAVADPAAKVTGTLTIHVSVPAVEPTLGLPEPVINQLPVAEPDATLLLEPTICNGCGVRGTGRRYDSAGGPQCPDCLARRRARVDRDADRRLAELIAAEQHGTPIGSGYVSETPIPHREWVVCTTPRCGRSAPAKSGKCGVCDPKNTLRLPAGKYRQESGTDLIIGNGIYLTEAEREEQDTFLANVIGSL